MDAVVFLAVLVGLAVFVAAPLYRPRAPEPAGTGADLRARRDALVRALRELDADRASGALGEPAYRRERDRLEAEAAGVLRELDGPSGD